MSNGAMNDTSLKLLHPPIVEAVLDIDCIMRSDFELGAAETAARDAYRDGYPVFQSRRLTEHVFEQPQGADAKFSIREGLQAYQFVAQDTKQLVQVRTQGYSFNRLAPYEGLDSYLPEIKRTWLLFVDVTKPLQVRALRLRFINRILLPAEDGQVKLETYLKIGPRLPDEDRMGLEGFMARNAAFDKETGVRVVTLMASQPVENDQLPVILDIEVTDDSIVAPDNWEVIAKRVEVLRELKNRVFKGTLEEECLAMFQS